MQVDADPGKVVYTGLSDSQWQAGRVWMSTALVNSEYWEHDQTKLVLHGATVEQAEEFTALLEAAR